MTRFILVSDLHGRHNEIETPDGDVLVVAGDVTKRGQEEEFVDFANWLARQPHEHKLFLPGNHDTLAYTDPDKVKSIVRHAHWLIDDLITIDGLRIYGSPWVLRDPKRPQNDSWWAYPLWENSDAHKEKWRQIPEGLDVLITHGPPYGISDVHHETKQLLGDKLLLQRVRQLKVKPKVHIFGHIHEGQRVTVKRSLLYLNASICDERGKASKQPLVVDFDKGVWTARSAEGPVAKVRRKRVSRQP